jgi:hypothetical protein
MGSLRDLWLLLTVAALGGAAIIPLAARIEARAPDAVAERTSCMEEWDQDKEWLPLVTCHSLYLFDDPFQGMLARPTQQPGP